MSPIDKPIDFQGLIGISGFFSPTLQFILFFTISPHNIDLGELSKYGGHEKSHAIPLKSENSYFFERYRELVPVVCTFLNPPMQSMLINIVSNTIEN